MIVCIDVDGVLRPFTERCAEVFIKYHPQFSGEEIRLVKDSRDIFLGYPADKDYIRNFIFVDKVEEVFLDSAPYPMAASEFYYLKQYCDSMRHTITIISSQPTYILKMLTIQWLHKNNFLTPNLAFIGYCDKYLYQGDILIDDECGNLTPWANSGRMALCYKRAWNASWTGPFINSLLDVIPILESMKL